MMLRMIYMNQVIWQCTELIIVQNACYLKSATQAQQRRTDPTRTDRAYGEKGGGNTWKQKDTARFFLLYERALYMKHVTVPPIHDKMDACRIGQCQRHKTLKLYII